MNTSPTENVKKLKNLIKYNASLRGMTLNELVKNLHEKYGRTLNPSSYSTRLKRGSLTIVELLETFDILGNGFEVTDLTNTNTDK